jgi:hypothetical protein
VVFDAQNSTASVVFEHTEFHSTHQSYIGGILLFQEKQAVISSIGKPQPTYLLISLWDWRAFIKIAVNAFSLKSFCRYRHCNWTKMGTYIALAEKSTNFCTFLLLMSSLYICALPIFLVSTIHLPLTSSFLRCFIHA